MSVSLSGSDTIQIAGRNLSDVADGDYVVINFPNDLANVKTGKNGNTIYASNQQGLNADMTIRVLLGSSDDQYLTGLMQDQINNFSDFTLLSGGFTKRVGDGAGNPSFDVYQCTGGIFKRQQDAKSSAEGDVEQSVAVFMIRWGNVQKSVQ